jgi:hypothetical protein
MKSLRINVSFSISLNLRFTVLYPFSDSRMLLERSCFSMMVCRSHRARPDVAAAANIGAFRIDYPKSALRRHDVV